MANIGFEYVKEGNNKIRITPKMGKLPKLEEYIEEARNLLQRGFKTAAEERLKDPSSQDFLDTMGIIQDFKSDYDNEVKVVVFSCQAGDVQVTPSNIDQIPSIIKRLEQKNANSEQSHIEALRDAVKEALEK